MTNKQEFDIKFDFATVMSGTDMPVVILNRELKFVYANSAYLLLLQRSWSELKNRYIFDAFPESEERVAAVRKLFETTFTGKTTYLQSQAFDIPLPGGEIETRYWQGSQHPVWDNTGQIGYMLMHLADVTTQVEAEMQQAVMIGELNHRTKNVLAVVQSITRLASKQNQSKDEFAKDLIARLGAMSRNHSRLYANEFAGMTINDLMNEELSMISSGEHFHLVGDEIMLGDKASKDLSMIVHELATNAAKHGCFSKESGRLKVSWKKNLDEIEIVWIERGVGDIGTINDAGFGSQLLRMIRNISVERHSTPDGLDVKMKLIVN